MKRLIITIILLGGGLAIYFLGSYTVDERAPHEIIYSKVPIKKEIPKVPLPELKFAIAEKNELDEVTAKIVGLDSLSYHERNDLVWSLQNRELIKRDFEALFAFMKMNPEKSGPQLSWHSLKNDLLTFVIVDGRYKETTGQLMVDIINDQEQHEVMREYVIQYIPDYFERHWLEVKGKDRSQKNSLSEEESALQQAFVNTMWAMLEDRRGPIPGTSLIRLHELSETFSIINKQEVDKATERMIMDQSMPVSSRMAALSVASERGLHQTLKLSEEIIFDPSNSVSLRMAALNSACSLNPDEELLERIQQKFIDNNLEDKRLIRAAYLTLKKLKKKRG